MSKRKIIRLRTGTNLFLKKAFSLLLALALFASHSAGASVVSTGEAQSGRPASGTPQRIVVFPLFAEEMLLEMGGPGRIVYVGHEYYENGETYSPTMELTKNIPGRYWDMADEEAILALNPDLIVLSRDANLDYAEAFPLLYQANIPLLMLETPKSVDGIRGTLAILGAESARRKAAQMAERWTPALRKSRKPCPPFRKQSACAPFFTNTGTARTARHLLVPAGHLHHDGSRRRRRSPRARHDGFCRLSADDLLTQQNPDLITYDYTDYDTDGSIDDISDRTAMACPGAAE